MKKILFILLAVAGLWVADASLIAADTNSIAADTNSIAADLGGIIARINEKLEQGKNTEPDLASNLVEFDALYARHKDEKSEAVVQILLAKVNLYLQVLHDPEKAVDVLKQVKRDFPGTKAGQNADAILKSLATSTELNNLIAKIKTKLQQGKQTENDLADNIKEFNVLLAKHEGEKSDEVANILVKKAELYLEVLFDPEKAAEVYKQIKRDFPQTKTGQNADANLESLQKPIAAEKIRRSLVGGIPFPGFNEKDLNGKPLVLADYKGKVVLIDFWATWCVPCLMEMPNVLKTYEKYHDKGFEVIGVSLDDDQQKLQRFLGQNNISWPQYWDGKQYDNKLAEKYGVIFVPFNYLLDGAGNIITQNLRGDALEAAVAKALANK